MKVNVCAFSDFECTRGNAFSFGKEEMFLLR